MKAEVNCGEFPGGGGAERKAEVNCVARAVLASPGPGGPRAAGLGGERHPHLPGGSSFTWLPSPWAQPSERLTKNRISLIARWDTLSHS